MIFNQLCSSVFIYVLSAICVTNAYNIEPVTPAVIMGESPFWDDETNTVIFVDIIGQKILRYDPAHPYDFKHVQFTEGRVSPAVPIAGTSSLLVGVGCSVVLADVEWGAVGENATLRSTKVVASVDRDKPGNRFNDGKADSVGRLWIGTMDDSKTSRRRRSSRGQAGSGSLYRFNLNKDKLDTERVVTHMEIPNGMVWTTNNGEKKRIYYLADSEKAVIYSYEFLRFLGLIIRKQVIFDFKANNVTGVPDGLTIDIEGNLWVACVHGGQVIQVNPRTGELLKVIPMGVKCVSAVEWGGPQRDVLYVTTSKYLLTEEGLAREPDAGKMFAITGLGTRGFAEMPYRVRSRSPGMKSSITLVGCLLAIFAAVQWDTQS